MGLTESRYSFKKKLVILKTLIETIQNETERKGGGQRTETCGDHFALYTHSESCCTSETYIMLRVNYTSIFKKIKVPVGSFLKPLRQSLEIANTGDLTVMHS